jgi:competence protein ComEC
VVGVGGLITLLSIRTSAASILVFSILVGSSCLAFREVSISQSLIAKIAIENQSVAVVGTVVSDSKITAARVSGARINQKSINFLMRVSSVTVAGKVSKVRIPVRVYSRSKLTYYPGEVIKVNGKLGLTKERRVSAALSSNKIQILSYGNFLDRGTTQIRSKFRAELARHGSDSAALIPGVVLGDTSLQSSEFTNLMRRVGLTHITAVSGANLAIVTGFILWISQWLLKSRRKRIFISVFFLIGFIFLVRASPSVLRAAVMAAVLLFAKSEGERRQSVPALGAAISLLLLVDPFQGVDAGFALSVLATSGIIFLNQPISKFLQLKLPKFLAEPLAIPIAATTLCTPVIVALSGQISLTSIPVNAVVAPAIAPLTIIGFVAALIISVLPNIATFLLNFALPIAWFITWVAQLGGKAPVLKLTSGFQGWGISAGLITLVVFILIKFRKRWKFFVAIGFLPILFLQSPWYAGGFPGKNWRVLQCDVGQGDAMLIRTAANSAIVVDVGPDPNLIDLCLRSAGVTQIDLLVLSHFHADHVAGLSGALRNRKVMSVWINQSELPDFEYRETILLLKDLPIKKVKSGDRSELNSKYGKIVAAVLWPKDSSSGSDTQSLGGEGSAINNGSIAIEFDLAGVTVFAAGDLEPEPQTALLQRGALHRVTILKMFHHGSKYQDFAALKKLSPAITLISVGSGNSYGHPALKTLDSLDQIGSKTFRSDLAGAISLAWSYDSQHRMVLSSRNSGKEWWRIRWS